MTQGKCPHPWNKNKIGTFQIGHIQINKGHGCFKKGNIPPTEINKKIQTERYKNKEHPFYQINKIAKDNAIKNNWYDIGKSNWIKLRKKIKERDNWTCQNCYCNLHNRKSNCHHKIPWIFSHDNSESNLVTVCIPCHMKLEYEIRKKLTG